MSNSESNSVDLRAFAAAHVHDAGDFFAVELIFDNPSATAHLHRQYDEFVAVHSRLLMQFPKESGRTGQAPRILPFLPDATTGGNEDLARRMRQGLEFYLRDLVDLPQCIVDCEAVVSFFRCNQAAGDTFILNSRSSSDELLSASLNEHPVNTTGDGKASPVMSAIDSPTSGASDHIHDVIHCTNLEDTLSLNSTSPKATGNSSTLPLWDRYSSVPRQNTMAQDNKLLQRAPSMAQFEFDISSSITMTSVSSSLVPFFLIPNYQSLPRLSTSTLLPDSPLGNGETPTINSNHRHHYPIQSTSMERSDSLPRPKNQQQRGHHTRSSSCGSRDTIKSESSTWLLEQSNVLHNGNMDTLRDRSNDDDDHHHHHHSTIAMGSQYPTDLATTTSNQHIPVLDYHNPTTIIEPLPAVVQSRKLIPLSSTSQCEPVRRSASPLSGPHQRRHANDPHSSSLSHTQDQSQSHSRHVTEQIPLPSLFDQLHSSSPTNSEVSLYALSDSSRYTPQVTNNVVDPSIEFGHHIASIKIKLVHVAANKVTAVRVSNIRHFTYRAFVNTISRKIENINDYRIVWQNSEDHSARSVASVIQISDDATLHQVLDIVTSQSSTSPADLTVNGKLTLYLM